MLDFALIGSLLLIHFMALMSPGPDFIVSINNTLTYSRKTGLFTAIGFGLGIAVHLFYCIAGLAVLISKTILLFSIIKYIGAGYIIYLGCQALFSKSSPIKVEAKEKKADISALKAIRIGFLTNVLNPKATLFFLSIFTLMITPDTSSATLFLAGGLMILNTILWFMCVALFFSQPRILNLFQRFEKVFSKTLGALLVFIGIKVALLKS